MIVVSIMGILTSLAIPNYLKIARRQVAITQMRVLASGIRVLKASEEMFAWEITGHGCSAGDCWFGNEKSPGCKARMDDAFKKLNLSGAVRDPWGGYYMLDENEGEFPVPGMAERNDVLLAYNADSGTYLVVPVPNQAYSASTCVGWYCGVGEFFP